MQDSEKRIPLFPLNIFLLPGEQLPLHIFEPRYRQLFQDAEDGLYFGLPYKDLDRHLHLVSICRLERITKRYPSGELDVIVSAEEIGELMNFDPVFQDKTYPGGEVKIWEEERLQQTPSLELVETFRTYIELRFGTKPLHRNIAHYTLMDLAASIAMGNEDKIKLITQVSPGKQEAMLLQLVKYINLLLSQEQQVENGFNMN